MPGIAAVIHHLATVILTTNMIQLPWKNSTLSIYYSKNRGAIKWDIDGKKI